MKSTVLIGGRQTLVLTLRVDSGAHKVLDAYTRDFDRILETQENAFIGAVLGRHPDDVLALIPDLTFGDFIALATCDGRSQCAFSRSVGAHDSVDFAFVDAQIQSFQDFLASDGDV